MGAAGFYLYLFLITLGYFDRNSAQIQVNRRRDYGPVTTTTPIPILRQINTHNQDGSYTYGYESADGTYKIETKSVSGEVKGKYGYYDDLGQLREIEYGADKLGFVPRGTGIEPSTLPQPKPQQQRNSQPQPQFDQSNTNNFFQQQTTGRSLNQVPQIVQDVEDDGQYRPLEYEDPYSYRPEGSDTQEILPQQQQQFSTIPIGQQRQRKLTRPRQEFLNTYDINNDGQQQPVKHSAELFYRRQNLYQGHPTSGINLNSGTYSVNY